MARVAVSGRVAISGRVARTGAGQLAQYQNLALRSEELDNAVVWINSGNTVTPNAIAAPDGTLSADRVDSSGGAGIRHYVMNAFTIAAPYQFSPRLVTMSCYFRQNVGTTVDLVDDRHTSFCYAWFDIQNGLVGSFTANNDSGEIQSTGIEPASVSIPGAAAAWWRCWMTYWMVSTSGGGGPVAQSAGGGPASADGVQIYDSAGGASCYMWGMQLVAGINWPGPYQKTTAAIVNAGTLRSKP